MVLTPEQLDKIWVRWRDTIVDMHVDPANKAYVRRQYSDKYTNLKRNYGWPKQFEAWLWDEGGMVQQVNHKRQIYFADESRAIMFALRFL